VALADALEQTQPRILTLDIETSPNVVYAWGLWGQNIGISQVVEPSRVLCVAAKWFDRSRVEFFSEHHQSRSEMLRAIWLMLDEADIVVGYNHVRFDIPHLNREFLLQGFGMPSPWQDVDLLRVNKKQFKWPSNKLAYVTEALGLQTKLETGGQALWSAVMQGDEAAWRKFKAYNIQDVRITEELFVTLGPWVKGPHRGLWTGDMSSCYACGGVDLRPAGVVRTKVAVYPQMECPCGAWCRVLRSGETRPA
jgi:DNA polymerase elongation subunit (family B)